MKTLSSKIGRTFLVARKSLLEMVREVQLTLLTLLLPLVFLVLARLMYTNQLLVTHPLLVSSTDPQGDMLIARLQTERYRDGRGIFDIELESDQNGAMTALKDQSATALLVIDVDKSQAVPRVTIIGDALNPRFYRASTILENNIRRYADHISGRPEVVKIVEQPVSVSLPKNEFDLYAPGMITFAILMIIPQTAMLVAREVRWNTLRRLRITRLGAGELLGGISLAQMVVALVQVIIIFAAALGLGFHNQGSLWLAILVGLVLSFSAIGQGMVVACFSEDDSQAANVGSTLTMLQVFLSGSFYQIPPMTMFTLAGHQIDLFDIIPATHGFFSLQQVLSFGAEFRDIAFRLGATVLLSAVYFWVGVVVFRRLKMRVR
jgi:ABC-2 type transport system permease protein